MSWLFLAYLVNAIAWIFVVVSTLKYLAAYNRLVTKIKTVNRHFYEATYRSAISISSGGNRLLLEHILHPEDIPAEIKEVTADEFRDARGLVTKTLKGYLIGFVTVLVLRYALSTLD